MSETRIIKLGCPICKGDSFEQYYTEQPSKIDEPGFSNAYRYEVSKCKGCGWQSAPFDHEEADEFLQRAFWIASMPKDRIMELREQEPNKFFIELPHSLSQSPSCARARNQEEVKGLNRVKEIMRLAHKLKWVYFPNKISHPLMQLSEVEKCMLAMYNDFDLNRMRKWVEETQSSEQDKEAEG